MIEVKNGVFRLEPGDLTTLFPAELLHVPDIFYAPYGFKLIDIGGKQRWGMATLEEYRTAVVALTSCEPEDVKPKTYDECYSSSPMSCEGGCPMLFYCGGYFYQNPYPHVFCMCTAPI